MKIYINPGHHVGIDSGAVNPETGLTEAEYVLELGEMVKDHLIAAGCEVRLLQSDNIDWTNPSFANPIDEANEWGADVFVSLHCNAVTSHAARGTEICIYKKSSQSAYLAQKILREITEAVPELWDRGLKERPGLLVLKYTDMPAVLIECAFIDNPDDLKILLNQKDAIARAIARGVTDYERDFF